MTFKPRIRWSLRLMLLLIAGTAVVLGGFSFRIKHQQTAVHQLRDLGAQVDLPPVDVVTWFTGMTIESIQFLGPAIGDEQITDIAAASDELGVRRITFMETRVTPRGQQQLQARLPRTKIQLVTGSPGLPGVAPIPAEIR